MAGVIKSSHFSPGSDPVRTAPFSFTDMGDKADAYLNEVRSQAAQIIAQAKTEAVQIKAQAEADGKLAAAKAAEAGVKTTEAALKQRFEQHVQHAVAALKVAADQTLESNRSWQRECENHLGTLAVKIAAKVIRREVSKAPELVIGLAREALGAASAARSLSVRLNPEDHAAFAEEIGRIGASLGKLGEVKILADASVTRGGCRVHTQYGVIDQQIESQLQRIAEELA